MSDFQFGEVAMLHWLWLIPALAALMIHASRRRRQALRRFVEAGLLARLGRSSIPDPSRRVLKGILVLAALGCLVIALARPAWDFVREEVTQRGRDVVFLLDVSRSMLAEDLPPSRLERAKLAILDAVDRLEGDRVALAVFAGATVVKCPLTLDYAFFRMALDDVSPLSVSRGGTLIGDGIRTVLRDVFDGKRSNYRDIVLITDGEDHESFPVEAASEAGNLDVRLIAVGLGDEQVGQRIPVGGPNAQGGPGAAVGRGFLRYEGQEVWSKLDAATLRRMADATPGGLYLNVATGAIDFGEVYRRLVASAESREIGSRTIDRLEERFQLFLAICIILLALETGLRERKRSARGVRAAAVALAASLAPPVAQAASVRGLVNEGNEFLRADEYENALRVYGEALERDPSSPHASLNRANALYRSGDFAGAAEGYRQAVQLALERDLPHIEAAALHNRGNALYRQAEEVASTDPGKAIEWLAPAARSYLGALRKDGQRMDSAHNLEVARRLIRQLREQAAQQPRAGPDGEQDESSEDHQQDRDEALQQAAEEQQRLADASEELQRDREENRGADDRERQQQRAQDLAEQQQDLNRRTEQLEQSATPQAREQIQNAAQHQQQAQENLEQNRPGRAEESQRHAAEALRQAAAGADEREGQEEQAQQGSGLDGNASQVSQQEQEMTVEQILGKEQRDRRRRQLQQRVGVVAVEKDW